MTSLERPKPEIIHKFEDPFKHSGNIKAFLENERVGSLAYSRNYETGGWNIEQVEVSEGSKGKGIGATLIRSFVDQVGPGQIVDGAIIHTSTYQTLAGRYGSELLPGTSVDVPIDDFPNLALVRGFRFCGVDITRILIEKSPSELDGIEFNLELEGRTL